MQTITEQSSPMTPEVYYDIKNFIFSNIDTFRKDAEEYEYIDITIAVSDNGDTWNYQTGDNSYTGGAYSLPHWAVTSIYPDTDPLELYDEIIDQLEDLLIR